LFGRSDSDSFKTWAAVFADGIRHVGINANQNLYERGTYDERLAASDFGDLAANSGSLVFPDPTPVFADTYLTGSPRNYQKVSLPEVDALFKKQEAELDPQKRFDLQVQMQKAYLAVYPETSPFTVASLAFWDYVKNIPFNYGSIYQGKKRQYVWLDT
jgi:ABC-type transport system substrate-binding protein